MNVIFDPGKIDENGEMLFIKEVDGGEFISKIEKYSSSRHEKVYELIEQAQ